MAQAIKVPGTGLGLATIVSLGVGVALWFVLAGMFPMLAMFVTGV